MTTRTTRTRSTAQRPRRVILPLLALCTLIPATGRTAPPPGANRVTLEVSELDARGARSAALRFSLALGHQRLPAELESASDRTSYRIHVSRAGTDRRGTLVRLDLRRQQHRKDHNETIKLSVAGRVAPGKRAVLGRVARAGGGALEVAVTLE